MKTNELHKLLEGTTRPHLLHVLPEDVFEACHIPGSVNACVYLVELREGALVSASFEIDMRSIACSDIADDSMRAVLIRHLMHSDFFDVENHPVARFEVTSAVNIVNATEGTPNVAMAGDFTLRGITHPLQFPAVVAFQPDGSALTAQAMLDVDRTQFGSVYGSGRFFRMLGQHLVNDHFHIHLKIHASSRQS